MLYILIILILIIFLSLFVVFSKNTITSMISLIWCFILTGIIFLLLGAEFLTFTLIIVYGSAISILFLFIIMLLNLRIIDIYHYNYYYLPICIFICIFSIILINLFLLKGNLLFFFYYNNITVKGQSSFVWINYYNLLQYNSNIYNFGIVLFNHNPLFVILAGIILLIAMLGSILLVNTNYSSKDVPIYCSTRRKHKIKNFCVQHYGI